MGAGAYILGCEGPRLTRWERDFFRDADPWGFILFARNIEDPEQVAWLTTELREAVGRDAPIFVDQEGGRVARMRPPHWRDWLPPLEQVKLTKRKAAEAMYLRYRIIAHELRAVGIDGNCAPVLDLVRPDTHEILANRCYGDDVVRVADIAGAAATGLVDGGVLPVIKHIPGHGRATADSHLELPVVKTKEKALNVSDFLAFQSVAGLPIAMTAHVVYADIDPDAPATTSHKMISIIRDRIKFGGLLMSDDISMKALAGSFEDRCHDALQAGCDLILHCNGERDEMQAVVAATGRLAGQAAVRAEAALTWRKAPDDIDIAALDAEFHSLMTHRAG
ncbi:beta-N-acetylhexosaminidase [Maritimibacter alkaliphilus HTCC2654]|uniref:beta-N-acetylhexosaminidase n=1 Tax=Maritimibacter alkaliphilus HTCC2654 TaxID=314271 RepID=A3VLD2_9RHOB|nr:beta-N-acetylhexosaminidase [Maritimibacter alkaliphilus]EAQ10937.1 Putative Glycoside hydrolase [Rhodobacterales bacterium HTCC2654] [Maritimibacter alkaliphilus HTCC2654]TYP81558.1 beta-N-acetylhexosaminidase [Maritimibacter alkaliphilus HTCC2654]